MRISLRPVSVTLFATLTRCRPLVPFTPKPRNSTFAFTLALRVVPEVFSTTADQFAAGVSTPPTQLFFDVTDALFPPLHVR